MMIGEMVNNAFNNCFILQLRNKQKVVLKLLVKLSKPQTFEERFNI